MIDSDGDLVSDATDNYPTLCNPDQVVTIDATLATDQHSILVDSPDTSSPIERVNCGKSTRLAIVAPMLVHRWCQMLGDASE